MDCAVLQAILRCLEKRYSLLREIGELTKELAGEMERGDSVSVSLLLTMRGEKMQRHALCEEELARLTQQEPRTARALHRLAFGPLPEAGDSASGSDRAEAVQGIPAGGVAQASAIGNSRAAAQGNPAEGTARATASENSREAELLTARIYEVRRRTQRLLDQIRRQDEALRRETERGRKN